ncbi:energy-coupled thiamine transporter ThiT [Cytobacillus praedii]|uniref:energy-coupled thiamine transporter ThiT n=1 Tax=Cytobacillus praedii TaxID=1742358 RepID=UPI002E22CEA0|nr:energy-coupled thiamine transporter ThiT [Cytobacillus praedii]MED3550733.1 energy-coupled thiamine transporter ThiT [Cytobacillus praedii]MED3575599.1 energy-coupled thiamine transporter ThiT [Cytobacillus praedii]
MKKLSLIALIEASFFAAFAIILDLLPSIKPTPNISISVAMLPIFILAFRWGFRVSLISGFMWGILQIVLGDAWIVTPIQTFIEYVLAFAFIGFAGLFFNSIQKHLRYGKKKIALAWIVAAIFVGSLARYFWHFLAGILFFGSYAPEGMSPFLFSFAVNGATALGSWVLCSIVTVIVVSTAPRLIIRKNEPIALPHNKAS